MLGLRKYKNLEKALGHRFRNQELLTRALTHSSAGGGKAEVRDNERLEFIGDRVLGLVIAENLGETFPTAREGDLARRFNQLVRREACASVGRRINLGAHLILSESEASNGGREKDTIIADAVEALLAAVLQDAGFDKARKVVLKLWAGLNTENRSSEAMDAKTALQEWAQGRGLALPAYKIVGRSGPDHAPHFKCEVVVTGFEPAPGGGASKRSAEQAAASTLLIREGVWEQTAHG